MTLYLRTVQFDESGVTFEYMREPEDVRDNGMVLNHVLHVPGGRAMVDLREHAEQVLSDALDDFEAAPGMASDEPEAEQEQEGHGPYDNPEER